MQSQQALLNIACSVKSRCRTITYTRSNRDEVLHFSVLGGYESGYGIFVSKVDPDSQAEKVGLKRGDQVHFRLLPLDICWYIVELLMFYRFLK